VRIVSLLPSATDMLGEMGLLGWVVGISDDCDWPPEVRDRPLVARSRIELEGLTAAQIDELVSATDARGAGEPHSLYAVDAELMDSLHPDLVITQDLCEVCAVSSGDLGTACPVGADVYSVNARTLDEVIDSVVALAERLDVPERGLPVAARMRDRIEAVRAAVSGLARPRVFVAEWMDPPYGSGHWVPEMVDAAGGTNVLSNRGEYSFPTTWDAVLAAEPALVVLAACGLHLEDALALTGDLRLPVKSVVVDGDAYFSRPGPRVVDGVGQLAHLLHPEAVADPGLPCAELLSAARVTNFAAGLHHAEVQQQSSPASPASRAVSPPAATGLHAEPPRA
jgi:iron complex transport system substrate-binding protein